MYSDGDFFDIFLIERCFFGSLVQTQSRHRANIIELMQDFCKISRFLIDGIIVYRFTSETIRKSIINVGGRHESNNAISKRIFSIMKRDDLNHLIVMVILNQ